MADTDRRDVPCAGAPTAAQIGVTVRVRGVVQGVGFRPFVWRLACEFGISGEVRNDAGGVLVHARGSAQSLRSFVLALRQQAPPLAVISALEQEPLAVAVGDDFRILSSGAGAPLTGISSDAAVCVACMSEVLDTGDRRYRYPFANCTDCGPRLSIVRAIPWDRANTAMADFEMCAACAREYRDPTDRRFHAQPVACPACGPRAWIEDGQGADAVCAGDIDAVAGAARLLASGAILAIKGIGGFHLACDAGDEQAVGRLRAAKHRDHKPFALMAHDVETIRRHARVSAAEQALLQQPSAPIVLLDGRPDGTGLAAGVAPGHDSYGFMLPYTPLHHLLLADVAAPLVFTSGNRSDEPQCTGNEEARERLAGIADAFLMHDRDIVNRLDDSVLRMAAGAPRALRRARGLAPGALPLPAGFEPAPRVLAMGGDLKNSFCLLRAGEAVVSQHSGDLRDARAHDAWRDAIDLYATLYRFEPQLVAVDLHPDYLSNEWGQRLAERAGVPLVAVQHHHAHAAAVMLEHALPVDTPVLLAVVMDGLGMGDDGSLWGAEFACCDYRRFERLASFQPMPLPGGDRAMREPWRNAWACLHTLFGWAQTRARWPSLDIVRFIETQPLAILETMLEHGVNSPVASSAGRLFDAVAAVLGVCTASISHEGQAAMELETLAARWGEAEAAYGFEMLPGKPPRLGWQSLWCGVLDDLAAGVPREAVAARFHATLVEALAETAIGLAAEHAIGVVVLAGGVFQNRMLLEGLERRLRAAGLTPLLPARLPANDGGLAAGQALVASARLMPAR